MSIIFNNAGITLSLSWLFIGIFVAGWLVLKFVWPDRSGQSGDTQ